MEREVFSTAGLRADASRHVAGLGIVPAEGASPRYASPLRSKARRVTRDTHPNSRAHGDSGGRGGLGWRWWIAGWFIGLAALVAGAAAIGCEKGSASPSANAGREATLDTAAEAREVPDTREAEPLGVPTDAGETGQGSAERPLGYVQHVGCTVGLTAESKTAWIFFSPARPVVGAPLRVIGLAERNLDRARLVVDDGHQRRQLGPVETWGGPPWGWTATVPSAPAGTFELCLASRRQSRHACVTVEPAVEGNTTRVAPATGIWQIERNWDRGWEVFYQAWIARLFLVEPGLKVGWRPLHKVLRDPTRNLLWGHLGWGEDDPQSAAPAELTPDCGDAPYFLRAYFAWKHRLPFAAHVCERGTPASGPECSGDVLTNLSPAWDDIADPVVRMNRFLAETLARLVHTGTARSLVDAEVSDFYPLPLSRAALRPGTIFVDSRGHILILTRWLPARRDRVGTLLAVDGHPDQSITHKRYSRTTYFFTPRTTTGGFKAFRPLAYIDGQFCFATNAELEAAPPNMRYSTEQYQFRDAEKWYAHLEGILNPERLEPLVVFRDRLDLLVEMLMARERAVRLAFDFMEQSGWNVIPMPSGAEIFASSGPWEQYSSPGRDMRLLVMADEILAFPAQVEENPGAFHIPEDKTPAQARAEVEAEWQRAREEMGIEIRRSDGSIGWLTLGMFVDRLRAFEMAYNPNDCPEVRWGASETDPEYATCTRRAPPAQRRSMESYRRWFATRRQPAGL